MSFHDFVFYLGCFGAVAPWVAAALAYHGWITAIRLFGPAGPYRSRMLRHLRIFFWVLILIAIQNAAWQTIQIINYRSVVDGEAPQRPARPAGPVPDLHLPAGQPDAPAPGKA